MRCFILMLLALSLSNCQNRNELDIRATTFYFDYHALDFAYKERISDYPAENIGIDIQLVNYSTDNLEIDFFSRDKEMDSGCFIQLATKEDTISTWTILDKLLIPSKKDEYVPFLVPFQEYPKFTNMLEKIGNDDYNLFFEMEVLFTCPGEEIKTLNTNSMRTFIQFADSALMILSTGEVLPSS